MKLYASLLIVITIVLVLGSSTNVPLYIDRFEGDYIVYAVSDSEGIYESNEFYHVGWIEK